MKFKYTIKKSKRRKNVAIVVTDVGELIVKIPYNYSIRNIDKLLIKHSDWIDKKIRSAKERSDKFKKRNFTHGENFLFLGKWYPLIVTENSESLIFLNNSFYLSKDKLDNAKELFYKWYFERASEIIFERVDFYSNKTGLKPKRVKLSKAKKRWGSCSSKGNINLNWRLVMSPMNVIDYVVVHELVHLKIMNHSKDFWCKVEEILPNFKQSKRWLNENRYIMNII
ncbi:M48 family metallopeptidase [Persephonella sp.]